MCLAEGFLSLSLVLIECFLIMVCSGEAVYSVALATLVEWAGGGVVVLSGFFSSCFYPSSNEKASPIHPNCAHTSSL